MIIRGLCIVKNEADIIEESLRDAGRWCDKVYVLDNGSGDGTWERVQSLARELPHVIPHGRDPRPFNSGIREELLRHYGSEAHQGDWWCILDADEFYVDDPRTFLTRVPRRHQVVWKQDISYYFTEVDLAAYREDPSLYADDVSIHERLRYYRADWSEIRFFRHRTDLRGIPWDSPRTYPRRIRVKHFQYRSPSQIQKRIETRREPMARGSFPHEKRMHWTSGAGGGEIEPGPASSDQVPEHWEERVVPTTGLHYDLRDGTFAEGKPWAPPPSPSPFKRIRAFVRWLWANLRDKGARLDFF